MRDRYKRLVPRDYSPEYGDEDCEYTVEYFREVAGLYERAAKADRAVVFTVSQSERHRRPFWREANIS
jgi:hypothetical protein